MWWMISGLSWSWLLDVVMLVWWCTLCVDVSLLLWVFVFCCLSCFFFRDLSVNPASFYVWFLRFSTRWLLVLLTICFISWWIVIWSEDHFSIFCIKKIVFRVTLIIFIFRDYIGIYVKVFYNTTEDKSFIFVRRFGWTSFDEVWVSKNQDTAGLEVEISARHHFWIFDVSFTKIKRIIITTTLIIITILIIGVWGWLN